MRRTKPCSMGVCSPQTIACWHAGERTPVDITELAPVYMVLSWAQWSWKIGEEILPGPISRAMKRRRKAKKKRIKAAQRRREEEFDALYGAGR